MSEKNVCNLEDRILEKSLKAKAQRAKDIENICKRM